MLSCKMNKMIQNWLPLNTYLLLFKDLVSKGYVRVRFSKTRVCSTQYLNVENAIHVSILNA